MNKSEFCLNSHWFNNWIECTFYNDIKQFRVILGWRHSILDFNCVYYSIFVNYNMIKKRIIVPIKHKKIGSIIHYYFMRLLLIWIGFVNQEEKSLHKSPFEIFSLFYVKSCKNILSSIIIINKRLQRFVFII